MKSQVPFVWLVANLLHPILLIIWFGDWNLDFSSDDIGIALMIFLYAMVFSMPSLILGFGLEYLISRIDPALLNRYLYWLLLSPFVALLNWVFVALLFGGQISWNEFHIAVPSMVSVLLASLIRYKAFLKEEEPVSRETNEQETNV